MSPAQLDPDPESCLALEDETGLVLTGLDAVTPAAACFCKRFELRAAFCAFIKASTLKAGGRLFADLIGLDLDWAGLLLSESDFFFTTRDSGSS